MVDTDYMSRKEGWRGLASIKDCIDTSIQGLEKYTKTSKERIIIGASNGNRGIHSNSNSTVGIHCNSIKNKKYTVTTFAT